MSERRTRLDATAMVVMVLLCATWGLQQVAIKVANAGISPVLQAGLRSIGACALLWLWSAHRGIRLFDKDGSLIPGLVAAALFAGEFALLYWGLTFTAASRSVIFLYTAPFVVALGAHVFLPGERLQWLQWAGLVCAFIGICIAFADALRLPTHRELTGDVMALLAALFWGATTVMIKASRLVRVSPNKILFYQLAGSGLALPLVSLALHEPGITNPGALVLASLLFQVVVVAFVSYLAWFWLITCYPASQLSVFSFLTPLFGVLAGGVLLSERVSALLLASLLLVALGIYLVNRPR